MKRKQIKKEITGEDIQSIRFKDICGTATPAELRILKKNKIPSFMLKTVDAAKHFPITCNKNPLKELKRRKNAKK